MRTGILATVMPLVALPLVVLSGCSNMYKERVNQQLWERELRLQEDCIWRLKWELEDKQRELDTANARLSTQQKASDTLNFGNRVGGGGGTSGPDLGAPPLFNGSNAGRGSEATPPTLPPAPNGLPEIDHGQEFTPGTGKPKPPGSSQLQQRGPALSAANYTTPANPLRGEKLDPDMHVERIVLNPGLTGDVNATGNSGGKTFSVAIEQRDIRDLRVLAPGDVTIVVVDPALEGKAARIARWQFDSDEVAQHVRKNHDGGSLQFELPWPAPPEHSDLRVYVRFTTFDGRRLEANLPIDISLADNATGDGWNKSTTPIASKSARPSDDDSNATASSWSVAPAPKAASVYDRKPATTDAAGWDDAPPREASKRPAWSPNR